MRFYAIVVEQLDMAAELLQKRHPMESRLALILVDNAVEYALHRYATDYFKLNIPPGAAPIPEKRKFYKLRDKTCGQCINPKVAFAEQRNAITADQASFIRVAHKFRNQAYHAGRAHDSVISELVTTYFVVCCDILPSLAPKMMRSRSSDAATPRVAAHIRSLSGPVMPGAGTAKEIVASLFNTLPDAGRTLAEALRQALESRLMGIEELVAYLVKNDPSVVDAESLIRDIQFWGEYWGAAPPEGFTFRDDGKGTIAVDPLQQEEYEKLQETMRGWCPKVSPATLKRWERRIGELTDVAKPGELLQKYWKLVLEEIEPFEKIVRERCAAFDHLVEE